MVLPHMLEKDAGVIVNISSLIRSGMVTNSTYTASKAYVAALSDCLYRTYKDSGTKHYLLCVLRVHVFILLESSSHGVDVPILY